MNITKAIATIQQKTTLEVFEELLWSSLKKICRRSRHAIWKLIRWCQWNTKVSKRAPWQSPRTLFCHQNRLHWSKTKSLSAARLQGQQKHLWINNNQLNRHRCKPRRLWRKSLLKWRTDQLITKNWTSKYSDKRPRNLIELSNSTEQIRIV